MVKSILKNDIIKYSSLKGRARGMAIKGEAEYILHEMGEKGLEKLEKEMKKIGCSVDYKKLKVLGFYPLKYEALTTLVLEKIFDFDDDRFRKAGQYEAKISFIIRMFMRYFYSMDAMAKQAPIIWDKYYDIGSLEVVGLDKDKKKVSLIIRNFTHHPRYCRTLEGFIGDLVKMMVKTDVLCREKKCVDWGDEYHEFVIKW